MAPSTAGPSLPRRPVAVRRRRGGKSARPAGAHQPPSPPGPGRHRAYGHDRPGHRSPPLDHRAARPGATGRQPGRLQPAGNKGRGHRSSPARRRHNHVATPTGDGSAAAADPDRPPPQPPPAPAPKSPRRRRAVSLPTRLTAIAALLVAATVLVVAGRRRPADRDDLGAGPRPEARSAAASFREGPAGRVKRPGPVAAEPGGGWRCRPTADDEVIAVRTTGGRSSPPAEVSISSASTGRRAARLDRRSVVDRARPRRRRLCGS